MDLFVENNFIKKVKTDKDVMRYDPLISNHHHLYCSETERIEDFDDDVLNKFINEYFSNNRIKNFKIADIKLQITGKFNN